MKPLTKTVIGVVMLTILPTAILVCAVDAPGARAVLFPLVVAIGVISWFRHALWLASHTDKITVT